MKASGILAYMVLAIALGFVSILVFFILRFSDTEPNFIVPQILAALSIVSIIRAILIYRSKN